MTRVSSGADRVQLLVDDDADASFRELGYAIVPLVDPGRLEALRAVARPLIPADSGPFFSLYRNDSPDIRRTLDRVVQGELRDAAATVLRPHHLFLGSLLVKFPGDESYLEPHQDWSFVDEERHVSGILWLPLAATDETNGGMFVVPGSHRLDLPHRGAPLDYSIERHLDDVVQVRTEPGEALICHNALIHGSAANHSDELRVVMVLGVTSAGAALYHFFTDESGQKWRYHVTPEFFFDHRPPQQPSGSQILGVEAWDTAGLDTGPRTHLRPDQDR